MKTFALFSGFEIYIEMIEHGILIGRLGIDRNAQGK